MTAPDDPSPLPLIDPLGDRGWLVHFSNEPEAAAWAELARKWKQPGVIEIVPAYRTVAVICDPATPDVDWQETLDQIRLSLIDHLRTKAHATDPRSKLIEVPVVYDGPDLAEAARRLGLTEAEIVHEHTSNDYQVFAVGFLPGFPYAGYLPERISGLPRRSSPRLKVPAGSVAITGRQTGIYPCESPGGWHLLGRTDMTICDLKQGFFRFRPGDRVRFVATSGGVMP